jgi:tetratricopeptide (TPR) repeat protein
MKYTTSTVFLALLLLLAPGKGLSSQESLCEPLDEDCFAFEQLTEAEQYEKIVEKINKEKPYSEAARRYIGKAYLSLAGREDNTPEQEEQYCRKAIEFGQVQAYMGLYFIYAQKDEEEALGFIREYIMSAPDDSVPYVILGESELEKKNYRAADILLRQARNVARARSASVDWMLFQTNYHLRNYADAGEMLASALENGTFDKELKVILSCEEFKGIEKRPEFKKYLDVFKEAKRDS